MLFIFLLSTGKLAVVFVVVILVGTWLADALFLFFFTLLFIVVVVIFLFVEGLPLRIFKIELDGVPVIMRGPEDELLVLIERRLRVRLSIL